MPMRSIPACAGEPGRGSTRCRGRGVYPRVCGGTGPPERAALSCAGLSPRVRGNPTSGMTRWEGRRSIPACAGEPSFRLAASRPARVYPRVCGGTPLPQHDDAAVGGLSPRVRGNPL